MGFSEVGSGWLGELIGLIGLVSWLWLNYQEAKVCALFRAMPINVMSHVYRST